MLKLKEFGALSSENFREFVEKLSKYNGDIPSDILNYFERNSSKERTIIRNNIIYKFNDSLGTNRFSHGKAYLSSYYLNLFVSYIIHYIFTRKYRLDTYAIPLGSKVISGKGYAWYEVANRGNLYSYLNQLKDPKEIDDILVRSIYEVSYTLTVLRKYSFVHNKLDCTKVLVHEHGNEDDDIRFRLTAFDDSYIEFNGVKVGINEPIFDIPTESPEIEYFDDSHFMITSPEDISGKDLSKSFREKRKKLISLDFYTFILSLQFHPIVVANNIDLFKFNMLMNEVFNNDIEVIEHIMYNMTESSINDIIEFLLTNEIKILYDYDIVVKKAFGRL